VDGQVEAAVRHPFVASSGSNRPMVVAEEGKVEAVLACGEPSGSLLNCTAGANMTGL